MNTSFSSCQVRDFPRAQLVSATGAVLINGSAASTSGALHTLHGLGFLKSEVLASNYCGPAYAKPVTVAFGLPGALGTRRRHPALLGRYGRRPALLWRP